MRGQAGSGKAGSLCLRSGSTGERPGWKVGRRLGEVQGPAAHGGQRQPGLGSLRGSISPRLVVSLSLGDR